MKFDAPRMAGRPRRRWPLVAIGLCLLLIVLPAGLLWYAVTVKPDYWPPADRADPAVRRAAEQFERAMRAQVNPMPASLAQAPAPAPAERPEWTAEVTQDQLNWWLAARLKEWGVDRGVGPWALDLLSRSMVNVDLDGLEVAIPFEKAGISIVVRFRYKPVVGADNRVRLVCQDAHAGLIPVPIRMALDAILAQVPEGQRQEVESLRAKALSAEALIPLRDGRKVSVIDMALLPEKFVITCRVLKVTQKV
jgi:hypothetical protein